MNLERENYQAWNMHEEQDAVIKQFSDEAKKLYETTSQRTYPTTYVCKTQKEFIEARKNYEKLLSWKNDLDRFNGIAVNNHQIFKEIVKTGKYKRDFTKGSRTVERI